MAEISLNFRFSSPVAEQFFNCPKRNILWNSGYGAGKTYAACQKALALMCKFPGYRICIGRYSSTELRRTTMQTFFKVCPPELYDEAHGGRRVDSMGYVDLINKSRIYWMHFDEFDESALRSLEINSAIIDQAEEIPEQVYLTVDSRVGRWDEVTIPEDIKPFLPVNPFTGRTMAPAYHILLANPPDEGEFSYLFQRFHPESPDYDTYKDTHAYFQSASYENKALPQENLATLLTRDKEWVDRYVLGKFIRGQGAIHEIPADSILEVEQEWVQQNLLKKGVLCRVLDHGASAPTCCLWFAAVDGKYFCYREYYQPDKVISYHRQRIAELSEGEDYARNLADPQIFKKTLEKYGGFWAVSDEYADSRLCDDNGKLVPPIHFAPADNNELATRNRINELLRPNPRITHPITGKEGAPALYFIKRTNNYPFGCQFVIKETSSQKKKLLSEVNGKKLYSDDRDDKVVDHAYDALRYYCASHLYFPTEAKPKAKPGSFAAARNRIIAVQMMRNMDRYGMPLR